MRKLILVLFALSLVTSTNADLLVGWDLNGINASVVPVFTNTVSAANITSNSCVLSLGAGVSASGTASTFGGTSFDETSLVNAIAANDYISWIVQADPGFEISVTNISWNFNRSGTGGSNLVLRSSFDGFASDLYITNDFPFTAGGGDANFALSLSGSNTVEFRIYAWGASAGSGIDRLRSLTGEDLVVQGTLVVPEPGTIALMGLGAVGFCLALLHRKLFG